MPIFSYLVIPAQGATKRVRERLVGLRGCEVAVAENRDVLILVTDTSGVDEENDLRSRIEEMEDIEALLLTFGEIDPGVDIVDPESAGLFTQPVDP